MSGIRLNIGLFKWFVYIALTPNGRVWNNGKWQWISIKRKSLLIRRRV
jgi:hypothetical protein